MIDSEVQAAEAQTEALIAELYQTEEKAEIINAKVVKIMSTGGAEPLAMLETKFLCP